MSRAKGKATSTTGARTQAKHKGGRPRAKPGFRRIAISTTFSEQTMARLAAEAQRAPTANRAVLIEQLVTEALDQRAAARVAQLPEGALLVSPVPEDLRGRTQVHVHQCYENARRIALKHGCAYVEGYAIALDGSRLGHAWNERGGVHFDATAELVDDLAERLGAPPEDRFARYPRIVLLRLTPSQLRQRMKARPHGPFVAAR